MTVIDEIEKQAELAAQKDSKGKEFDDDSGDINVNDEKLDEAIEAVIEAGQASTSYLQRKLKLGYGRAARLIDTMESLGIVGGYEGSKPRQVLITRAQWQELQMKGGAYAPAEEPEQPPVDRYGSIRDVFESRDALE